MSTTRWEKVYQGPFSRSEAENLVADLKKTANPEVNQIVNASYRRRKDHTGFDVYILTRQIDGQN